MLQLESVITRNPPLVIINGEVLDRGGVINGFPVVQIEPQTCVVEKDVVKLNLVMKQ